MLRVVLSGGGGLQVLDSRLAFRMREILDSKEKE